MSSARWTVGSIAELIRRIRETSDEEVWMRHVEISDRNAGFIADALIESRTMTEIWLSYCEISDTGAMEFARALQHESCVLKFLNLSGNNITENGANAIFSALHDNETLQCIFLNENRIGNNVSSGLAEMLTKNHHLREIYLWDNHLTDRACTDIEQAMLSNKTVTKCEIDNGDEHETNRIEDKELLESIRVYCQRNFENSKDKVVERNASTFRRRTRDQRDFEKV